ncbi:MAG: hypothetical protein U1E16_08425 [Hyphomicrobiales bacterium]
MYAYVKTLNIAVVEEQARQAERNKVEAQSVRERPTPLEDHLARPLATIPLEVRCEGLSLSAMQAALRGRWRGCCHPANWVLPFANSALHGFGDGRNSIVFGQYGSSQLRKLNKKEG